MVDVEVSSPWVCRSANVALGRVKQPESLLNGEAVLVRDPAVLRAESLRRGTRLAPCDEAGLAPVGSALNLRDLLNLPRFSEMLHVCLAHPPALDRTVASRNLASHALLRLSKLRKPGLVSSPVPKLLPVPVAVTLRVYAPVASLVFTDHIGIVLRPADPGTRQGGWSQVSLLRLRH